MLAHMHVQLVHLLERTVYSCAIVCSTLQSVQAISTLEDWGSACCCISEV